MIKIDIFYKIDDLSHIVTFEYTKTVSTYSLLSQTYYGILPQ